MRVPVSFTVHAHHHYARVSGAAASHNSDRQVDERGENYQQRDRAGDEHTEFPSAILGGLGEGVTERRTEGRVRIQAI